MLRSLVAPLILAVSLTPAPAAAGCCGAYCASVAPKPKSVSIDGRPYVRIVVSVECGTPVEQIKVNGGLRMDGKLVDSATKTCSGDVVVCRVALKKRNAPGLQEWRSVAGGSFWRWGHRHAVPVERSKPLIA